MAQPPKTTILDHFADLDDPRVERTRRHKLVDIIAIAICATICGADSWDRQEQVGLVSDFPGTAPRHSIPRHLRRCG